MAFVTITGYVYKTQISPVTGKKWVYYKYKTSNTPNGNYAEGDWQSSDPAPGENREKAIQAVMQRLGINRWDIVGEEGTAPAGVDINANYNKSVASANLEIENRQKQEAMKAGWKGNLSDAALQDIIADPGSYLPSYITKLPQEKAETLIKEGKIGGWQVGDRFFRTEQEANKFIDQNTKVQMDLPDIYQLQVTKDLKKKSEEFEAKYEPYTTIEGTTVYRPRNQPESVTVPRFGKMVPAKEDPATKFISENFENGNRFVSDRLMLHEILNPVIKSIEERKSIFTPVVRDASGRGAGLIDVEEFTKGAIKSVRDKPLTIAGNIALTLLITKGTGALVSKVPGLAAGVGKGEVARRINAVNILGVGLAGMYAGDVGVRYTKAPDKSEFAGELLATELIPFGVGGYFGAKPLRIKSNINEAIKILKSQKEPLKAFMADESGILRRTKWQTEAGKPERREVATSSRETKQGTDIFNYFKGRTPAQPLSEVGKGGLGEFKSPADRMIDQLTSTTGTGRESYLDYQKRVVSGILQPKASTPESFVAVHKKIPKIKEILKATTTKKSNMDTLNKLWEDRGLKTEGAGATTKEGQIVLTKQKTIKITKQEVKTAQIVKEKTKTIQLTKEAVKVVEKPKTGVYTIAYVSAATRLLNRLKENTQTANTVILREQARTKPQTFTSETAKAIARIKEITKAIVSERSRLAEREQVRERVREKVKEKQRTKTIEKTKMRVPERLVKLGLPKFASEISRIAKRRKKRSKYIWDVNNPVPTLEQVLG